MTKTGARRGHVAAQLDALYAELPTIDCQGLCHDSCGRIAMTRVEHQRIRDETGIDIPDGLNDPRPAICPALTFLNRCGAYQRRPMICRLWGLSEGLRCNYGCQPSRLLSHREAYEFLARAADIDGDHEQAAAFREPFTTAEGEAEFRRQFLADNRDRDIAYTRRTQRAVARGTAIYALGRGRLSRTPPGSRP